MWPYILLFILALANCFVNTKQSNLFILILFIFFTCLRYNVGFDYEAYLSIMIHNDSFSLQRMEGLERWLLEFCTRTKLYQLFFILNSIVTIICVYFMIEKFSPNKAISLFIFLTCPLMLTQSFSIVRHWTAVSLILYGTTFLADKKLYKFLFCIIFASLCHSIALVGLLYIPLFYLQINNKINILLLIISLLLGSVIQTYIINLLGNVEGVNDARHLVIYAQRIGGQDGLTRLPYLFLILDIILLFNRKRFLNKEIQRWINIYNVGVCFMFLFSFQATLSIRFSTVFLPAIIICIPSLIGLRITEYNLKKLFVFVTIFTGLFFYTLSIYNDNLGRSQYIPYDVFFTHF